MRIGPMEPKRLRLEELRKQKGLDWPGVAEGIGLSYDQVRRHEVERANFSLDVLDAYATLYDVEPAEIFADVELVPPRLKEIVATLNDLDDQQIADILDFIHKFIKKPAA